MKSGMKAGLKRSLLAVLLAADGVPVPESALLEAARIHSRPLEAADAEVLDALRDLEADRYAAGDTDDIQGRTWTLTVKGTHQARQIR